MKGWIIDYQANSGPDYTFRNIIVIVDKDEDSAKKIFTDIYDYPYNDNYLSLGFQEMVKTIIEDDPEEYMAGAWELSINSYEHYENVSSNEASYKDFYFDTEDYAGDYSFKDLIVGMIDILPSLNDYIKDKIGISSHYKIDDLIKSIDLDNSELLHVPGISPHSILISMMKKGIL